MTGSVCMLNALDDVSIVIATINPVNIIPTPAIIIDSTLERLFNGLISP